jgi:serine/threonine protein kinase
MSTPLAKFLEAPEHKRVLGAFRMVRPLGKGGFAPVWLAKEVYGDTELRTVAIKLFAPVGSGPSQELAHKPAEVSEVRQKRDMIIQEARALCRVEHPNVVRFYALAADPASNILGLVMEYVHGRPLDRILEEQRKLSVNAALIVGLAVASALTAIHQVGLIHRDIKPANLIEAVDVYKLIDFGIAAADAPIQPAPKIEKKLRRIVVDDLPFEVAGTRLSALTEGVRVEGGGSPGGLGFMSGTVGYIDPASLSAGPSPSSDLYSLGAMLFECLTGTVPAVAAARIAGKTGFSGEVLDGRAKAPALRQVAPDVPEPLAKLIDSLLDPNPASRPRSAEAVAWEIERIRIGIAG